MTLQLLLLLAALASAQAKVNDVTTIYRLTAGLEGATPTTLEESQKASCLVDSDVCDDWSTEGWTKTDSGLSGITFPASDQLPGDHDAAHQRAVTSEVFDIAVTQYENGSGGPVYMVFSTGADESVSDLLVLRFTDFTGASISTYQCLFGQLGNSFSFPDGTQRRCNVFAERSVDTKGGSKSEHYRIHLTPENLKVQRISDLEILFDVSNVNQLGDLKFFRMIADDNVQHTKAVPVLSLTSMSGSLRSKHLYHRSSAALCVSFSAFVDPRSGGSLTVTVFYDDGQRLPLGRVFGAEDASSRKAESQKFTALVDPSDKRSFKIDIQAGRFSNFPVLIADLTRCSEPERVEVHARTNARGLPFILSNDSFADPDVGVDFRGCHSGDRCSWERSNWNLITTPSIMAFGGDLRFSDGSELTEPFIFNSFTDFAVWPYNTDAYGSMVSILLLTDETENAIGSDLYVISLYEGWPKYYTHGAELFKCLQDENDDYYLTHEVTSTLSLANCQLMVTTPESSQYEFKLVPSPLVVSVTVINDHIKVNVDGNEIFDWSEEDETSSLFEVKNIRFGTKQMSANISIVPPVFAMSDEGYEENQAISATMTSPAFYSSAKTACVVVDYYTDDHRSVIGVKAERNNGMAEGGTAERTDSVAISNGNGLLQGWRRDTFEVTLPSGGGPHFITLEAEKPNSTVLWVQRIGGCNLQDDEDVWVFENDYSLAILKPGFDVASIDRAVSLAQEKCAHGGQVVDGNSDEFERECLCPAGFTGENCEKGCGANRYGADCGGRCSATERNCRGMLLCRPLLGCACAPGLTGPLCDQPCRHGKFGAGCAQVCGHCSGNSSCDIYTGECFDRCLPGFYPPLCQQQYKTLARAPVAKLVKDKWKISFSLDTVIGRGNAMFYIVQYRRSDSAWVSLPVRPVSSDANEAVLPTLVAGWRYQARVVLVDPDGGAYQADDVPIVEFAIPCDVSSNVVKLKPENITETSFTLTWKPLPEISGECPTTGYELRVKMGWEWQSMHLDSETTHALLGNDGTLTRPVDDKTMQWQDRLVPGHSYPVQIRAVSASGPAPFTALQFVTTRDAKPEGRVADLHTASSNSNQLKIVWSPPSNGRVSKYRLDYQCKLLLACPESDCSDSRGSIETSDLSATLTGLAPLARYKITVTTVPSASIHHATLMTSTLAAAPQVAPVVATLPVIARGNTSLTVRWQPVASCVKLNGFAAGYAVELWRAPLVAPIAKYDIAIGSEVATFDGLDPQTNYTIKVFVVTSSGWNAEFPLEFTAKTRAAIPGPVQALTVYKRGRRMLGLRWAGPLVISGPLRSFTITHSVANQSDVSKSVQIVPTPCTAWPGLFCHTINKLQPDTVYKVTVQAQNAEMEEDGEEGSLLTVTKEGMPTVPVAVRLAAATTTELTVQWSLPDLVNGQLRSFLVNVEQTDSANVSDCCQDFPMKEIIVRTEEPSYQLQMPGLLPASSYLLSVSAKTVSLGPSVSVSGHTRPAAPHMPAPPSVKTVAPDSLVIRVQLAPQNDLITGQLLLVASNDIEGNSTAELNIFDPWLAAELASLNATLFLVAEFSNEDVAGKLLTVTVGEDAIRGRFGLIQAPLFEDGVSYQLLQVTVLDYCGVLGVGYVRSEFFNL